MTVQEDQLAEEMARAFLGAKARVLAGIRNGTIDAERLVARTIGLVNVTEGRPQHPGFMVRGVMSQVVRALNREAGR